MIQKPRAHRREGVVLLAVLIVLVLLSLAAYQYSDLMTAEFTAADNFHKAAQARAYADSGIFYAAAQLSNPDNMTNNLGDNPDDNEQAFRNIAVGSDDGKGAGRFTLVAPPNPDDNLSATMRNGVTDETGKININAMMKLDKSGKQLYDMLMKLPNMTDEIANSIIYWADPAKTQRSGAAADDYYGTLNPPYRTRGGPLDTVAELLLVRGVTPELLYGIDLNRNNIQDPGEDDGSGTFDRGWSAFLTVHSREQIIDAKAQPLSNINDNADGAMEELYGKLALAAGEDLAKFVFLYRQYGPMNSSGDGAVVQPVTMAMSSPSGGAQSGTFTMTITLGGTRAQSAPSPATVPGNLADFTPDFTQKGKTKITSFFDLINAQVSVPGKTGKDPTTVYTSPLKDSAQRRDLFPKLFEAATVYAESEIPARINVNTAPREVLAALPNLTEADVQAIISARPKYSGSETPDAIFQTPAWLSTEANLSADTLSKLEKLITTRSQVFRVQSLGFSEDGQGASARVEAVIDTNGGRPRILIYRDLSDLGRGTATNR